VCVCSSRRCVCACVRACVRACVTTGKQCMDALHHQVRSVLSWCVVCVSTRSEPTGVAADPLSPSPRCILLLDAVLPQVRRIGMPSHVAAIKWHPRINQIFVGIGE
jgi:hypothetical protein